MMSILLVICCMVWGEIIIHCKDNQFGRVSFVEFADRIMLFFAAGWHGPAVLNIYLQKNAESGGNCYFRHRKLPYA